MHIVKVDSSAMVDFQVIPPRKGCVATAVHRFSPFDHPLPSAIVLLGSQGERIRWSVAVRHESPLEHASQHSTNSVTHL